MIIRLVVSRPVKLVNSKCSSQILQPDRPDELSRIQAAGGRVIYWEGARVLGVLAMSRAIVYLGKSFRFLREI
ncbi:hypothetical protein L1987_64323 [Smallanthus sonchifolius]|uniref:Uncharacterized protein n=1 Tax=Smallanthus sonchifolius TaxID=185202 RepID=A0ACB9CFR6_9ASTR|nr:hypothetical protein L1987_64323 [Smallanthus sonchifolius]